MHNQLLPKHSLLKVLRMSQEDAEEKALDLLFNLQQVRILRDFWKRRLSLSGFAVQNGKHFRGLALLRSLLRNRRIGQRLRIARLRSLLLRGLLEVRHRSQSAREQSSHSMHGTFAIVV